MPLMQPQEIAAQFRMLPPEFQKGVMDTDTMGMQKAIEMAQMAAAVSNDPSDPASQWKDQLQHNVRQVDQLEKGVAPVMAKKVFNLKRFAQMGGGVPFNEATPNDMFGAETSPAGLAAEQAEMQANPMMGEDQTQMGNQNVFSDANELSDALSQISDPGMLQQQNPELAQAIAGSQSASDALDRFFAEQNSQNRLELAEIIYKNLPPNMQNQQVDTGNPQDGMTIEAPYTQASVVSYLNEVTAKIQEAANRVGAARRQERKASKSFNLSKFAQHKTLENIIMPMPVRPSIHWQGQPVSDWHIIERNKGFGGNIGDVWNIDWESIWRGAVMDKFSRPYRDIETGEWVGGYIQNRFEVDKNIPATNNYQLLPGELRKPRLPQYGSLEARMQAQRNEDKGDLGKVYNDTSKPFNWNTAGSNQLTKTAQVTAPVSPDNTQQRPAPDNVAPPAPVDLGQQLFEQYQQNPNNFDWTQMVGLDENTQNSFDTKLKASRLKSASSEKSAQTDVTTEKQLANAARTNGGGYGNTTSIQRHQQDEPDYQDGSDYRNNYGAEIKNKSAQTTKPFNLAKFVEVKKKLTKMVDPVRR